MSAGQLPIFGLQSYFNSTGIRDDKVLQRREAKAESVERLIMKVLMAHPQVSFTPPEIHRRIGQVCELQSTRARLTTLTKWGYAVKLDKQRPGMFGMENNCWQFSGKIPPATGSLWPKLKTK